VSEAASERKLKLLVPTNFSRKSEMALDFALAQTQLTAAHVQVYLFHVFEDATKNFRRLDKLNEEYMERMKQTMVNGIERQRQQGVTVSVEDVHQRIAHGKAALEILKMAEGIQPDMIVMGAPTSNAFKKLVTNAPCTLVLVKHKGDA